MYHVVGLPINRDHTHLINLCDRKENTHNIPGQSRADRIRPLETFVQQMRWEGTIQFQVLSNMVGVSNFSGENVTKMYSSMLLALRGGGWVSIMQKKTLRNTLNPTGPKGTNRALCFAESANYQPSSVGTIHRCIAILFTWFVSRYSLQESRYQRSCNILAFFIWMSHRHKPPAHPVS